MVSVEDGHLEREKAEKREGGKEGWVEGSAYLS